MDIRKRELAWARTVDLWDVTKAAGTIEQYATVTFQDGSTITDHSKGTQQAAKKTGEIIHGTGRFQGIKGTITTSNKRLPPEKGELAGKSLGEGTITYTLPSR